MRSRFRIRIFLATFCIAAAALLLVSSLVAVTLRRQTYARIERGLSSETRLAAELLSHRAAVSSEAELQEVALALARDADVRVTLIALDGRVVGDSSQNPADVAQMENHGKRPEVMESRLHSIGVASRFSATLGIDMLYAAVPVQHPLIATVRLAVPLTEIDRQLRTIWTATLFALVLSVGGAFALSWIASSLLVRRLNRLADSARRYAAGDLRTLPSDHEDDEIGTVTRVLQQAVQQLGQRATDLARDRAQTEAILGGMIEGVLVVDTTGRVRLVNAAARRILGIEGQPIGHHYLEYVRHPAVVSELGAAARHDIHANADTSVVRERGRVFMVRAAPLNAAANGGAVVVLHDITDLDRMDQIRRDFVANVSHELRTPLTAIRGYVEALEDVADADERARFLEIIDRNGARMERLVTDLLRLARLEAGQETLQFSPCNLRNLFNGVAADLRTRIEDRRQRLDIDVDPSLDTIEADSQQLHDAVGNLLENAVIYSPEGATITLGAHRDGAEVIISIADEGPGIPPSDLTRVFERFYRVDKARSRESGGTGLGLAIVKHIVDCLGGTVRADNRPSRGAVFTIRLPLTTSAERAQA